MGLDDAGEGNNAGDLRYIPFIIDLEIGLKEDQAIHGGEIFPLKALVPFRPVDLVMIKITSKGKIIIKIMWFIDDFDFFILFQIIPFQFDEIRKKATMASDKDIKGVVF